MRVIICSSSGDYGDLIYQLVAMRQLANHHPLSTRVIVLLTSTANSRVTLDPDQWRRLMLPLLRNANYLNNITFADPSISYKVDYNFDEIRSLRHRVNSNRPDGNQMSISDSALLFITSARRTAELGPWLHTAQDANQGKSFPPVVISRTPRYHNPEFPWTDVMKLVKGRAVFVGTNGDHNCFQQEFGQIERHKVADFMELKNVISSAKLFIGNQSLPMALAQGIGAHLIQEVDIARANCIINRQQAPESWEHPAHYWRTSKDTEEALQAVTTSIGAN